MSMPPRQLRSGATVFASAMWVVSVLTRCLAVASPSGL